MQSQDSNTPSGNTNTNSNNSNGHNNTPWYILGALALLALVIGTVWLFTRTTPVSPAAQYIVVPQTNIQGDCNNVGSGQANCPLTIAPEIQAPAPQPMMPQPEAPVQNNDGEISCTHVNGGVQTTLQPGFSANGGHMSILGANGKWQDFLFVDDKVVVFRNTSSNPVQINSTDGFGLCSSSDFRLETIVRFKEGCDPSGCSQVQDVEITDNGLKSYVIKEDAYCGQNKEEYFCQ